LAGEMTLGEWVAFMNYATLAVFPVIEIARQVAELQRAQAAVERIGSLLETEPEIRDSAEVQERIDRARAAGAAEGSDGLEDEVETLAFQNVTFSYVDGHPVLHEIDLEAKRGEVVALVGPTGGGKSTLVQLACRFYEPDSGAILVNGRDYRERGLQWLQSRLGFVLQEPQLFGGSVADNIRYGRLEASDEEVREAARIVDADGFISELEKGYDAPVGEGGVKLSSGQRQLISFARALLADPAIFVMDEATASVDSETEQRIQEALGRVLAGRISFVIAHRLSTIRHADRVLFVDGGRIVEQGTHRELMRQRGRYFSMYTSQYQRQAIDQWQG
jgi:ATP-binding cassette subfamily B protein